MPLVKNIPGCQALYAGALLLWSKSGQITGRNEWQFTKVKMRLTFKGKVTAEFEDWNGSVGTVPRHLLSKWRVISINGRPSTLPPLARVEYRDYGSSRALNLVFEEGYRGYAIPAGANVIVEYPLK